MAAVPQPPRKPTNFLGVEEFPDDLVVSILGRVPCKDDRGSMSLVCKAWHDRIDRLIKTEAEAAPPAPAPPPLPWLLLPSRSRNDPAFFRAACVLSGCCVHPHHSHLTILPPGARFVGSYDGAWIFLYFDETHTHTHRLLNLRTGQARMLPEALVRVREGHRFVYSMVMLAATLSSSPDDSNCVGATIIARERDQAPDEFLQHPFNRWIVFWRMGWKLAHQLVAVGDVAAAVDDLALCLTEDVVYHDGAFHVLLTRGGAYQTLVCTPEANPEDPTALNVNGVVRRFMPPGERISGQNATVRARYLVVSRGELLMVVRYTTGADHQTSKFKVFRATTRPQMPDGDGDFPVAQYPWEWSEMDTLDGRILFVGYGCSRSYEADEDRYPGFEPGIYFLDDGAFCEALMIGDANTRPYPCRDNGMWSESEGSIQRCFPPPNSSDYSPPVWLLP
ncbi:uncharacterized protein LOC8071552 [Sorghum bicolor]|uniref:Uncharacterized protein n=1 Tax=Sorghum bicolor TaxID=4558 RepID=C5Y878_SORBI|nr:uncharacterized protein LOC8071552 [Sorghum bicolor]EES08289.1 hypothetical protein SORBI_3005G090100 [Sorghum bicolor]|eukprot:XP_002449301.1 uncharacterized protein LOC8071552 [Sorghum bicolor]